MTETDKHRQTDRWVRRHRWFTSKLEWFGSAHTGDNSPALKSLVPLNFELTNSLTVL